MGAVDPETGQRAGVPWEYYRWTIAERFGWTLPQVDALSMGDLGDWLQIQDAIAKYHDAHRKR